MSRTLPAAQVARLEDHPLAAILPPMHEVAFSALQHDIEVHGQRQAIVLLDGKILDGRHRSRALVNLGRDARVVDFIGDAPRDFVLSANVQRRHLTSAQAAMVAARLVSTRHGAHLGEGDVSQIAASAMLGVSVRYVRDAQWLIEHHPDLADEVFNGAMALAAAIRRARPPVQREPTREVLIDPHPDIVVPDSPERGERDVLAEAITMMAGLDPGAWVNALRPDQMALVVTLDNFARGAYDVADEGGLL